MLRENATVTVAHSRTKNLKELCKQADILIVAIGKPKFITEEYVKEGAVVIELESTVWKVRNYAETWILMLWSRLQVRLHRYQVVLDR